MNEDHDINDIIADEIYHKSLQLKFSEFFIIILLFWLFLLILLLLLFLLIEKVYVFWPI